MQPTRIFVNRVRSVSGIIDCNANTKSRLLFVFAVSQPWFVLACHDTIAG